MKKTILFALTLTIVLNLFVGCTKYTPATPPETKDTPVQTQKNPGNTQENTEAENPQTQPSSEAQPHVRVTKEEQVAKDYVTALVNKNYDEALGYLATSVEKNALVFAEDIEWAVPRTDFKDLDYFDAATTEYETELGSDGYVNVSLKDANGEHQTFKVKTIVPENGDGTPLVDGRGSVYVMNCTIRVPGGVRVYINGSEVEDDLIKERRAGEKGFMTEYRFPYLGRKDKTLRFQCDNYDNERTFAPADSNSIGTSDPLSFCPKYEDTDEVHEAIKTLWNDMYAAVGAEGSNASSLSPFIASDAPADTAQLIYDNYMRLYTASPKQKDHTITQVVNREGAERQTLWYSDHILAVNFGYEITWSTKYGNDWEGGESMRYLSAVFLAKENGEWKIYNCYDPDLFGYTNSLTKKW